ncbi:uncharacterized protein Tco025E_05503 [Trypanosoma conorhini]|uniref:Uncharacterized protein n=1 Tax=Trypanosoma conorhini TaxID=83891 RepID=A0A3R7RXW7_9TRYP|nr:uncharacterized protein Tco025E_05503 [Trypanosoma conorhini]RNF15462.1 hypothetical protein Tco025E_05503 [Trypanosoma conorhini]
MVVTSAPPGQRKSDALGLFATAHDGARHSDAAARQWGKREAQGGRTRIVGLRGPPSSGVRGRRGIRLQEHAAGVVGREHAKSALPGRPLGRVAGRISLVPASTGAWGDGTCALGVRRGEKKGGRVVVAELTPGRGECDSARLRHAAALPRRRRRALEEKG